MLLHQGEISRGTKFMYLYTFGGLSDTIRQIMWGCQLSARFKRWLIIDTTHSTLRVDIQQYFDINQYNIYRGDMRQFYQYASPDRVIPDGAIEYVISNGCPKTNILCPEQDSEADIIVCGKSGLGGTVINQFIKLFLMTDKILTILRQRFYQLPEDYISVHIRNTDYQSDVELFIEQNRVLLTGKNIFLASDNTDSINLFKNKVDAIIYQFANIPNYNHDPNLGIHKYVVNNKNELNIDSIVDLVLLSLGERVLYSCKMSNYSKNAFVMNSDVECRAKIMSQIND